MKKQNSNSLPMPLPFLETWLRLGTENQAFFIKDRYSRFLIEEIGDLESARLMLDHKMNRRDTGVYPDCRFF